MFQLSGYFCVTSLDLLQQIHIFHVTEDPSTSGGISPEQRKNLLFLPADHVAFDANAIGFLGCERTLLGLAQLFIHQLPKSFSTGLLSTHSFSNLCWYWGLTKPMFALGCVEFHDIREGSLVKPVEVPLDDIPSLQQMNCTIQLASVLGLEGI